jgi:hypothetical protein
MTVIAYFEKGSSFHLVPQKLDKRQPQRFCANEYFVMLTLSAPPDPNTFGKLRLSAFYISY